MRLQSLAPLPSVIAIVGSKGGTLKTATAATVGHVLADRGYRVTLVDLDPQGSLTLRCGFPRAEGDPLMAEPVGVTYQLPREATSTDPGGELVSIAGSVRLLRGGRQLETATQHEAAAQIRRAAGAFGPEVVPDFMVIDTPPALGTTTQEAMRAAHIVVVPTDPTREGLQGVADVIELRGAMRLTTPMRAVLSKVIYLLRDQNEIARRQLDADDPYVKVNGLRARAEVPFSKAGAESSSFELPVTITAVDDRASAAYRKLVAEIGGVMGLKVRQKRLRARVMP